MTDPTLISTPNWSERLGMALLELIEHLPTGGFGAGEHGRGAGHHRTTTGWCPGSVPPGLDTGARISARDARRLACNAGDHPRRPRWRVPAAGPGPDPAAALGCPTQRRWR